MRAFTKKTKIIAAGSAVGAVIGLGVGVALTASSTPANVSVTQLQRCEREIAQAEGRDIDLLAGGTTKGVRDNCSAAELASAHSFTVYLNNLLGVQPAPAPTPTPVTPTPTPTPVTPTPTPVPPTPPVTKCPQSAADVPDGTDPHGGCFPGPATTGFTGTLTPVAATTKVLPTGNSGWYTSSGILYVYNSPGAKVSNISFTGNVEMLGSSSLTITNSEINGTINNDTPSSDGKQGQLTVVDTTINGGSQEIADIGTNNAVITGDNISGGQHGVSAEGPDVTVSDTYIHDLYMGNSLGWHQNAIFDDSGSNLTANHDSLSCNPGAGCTADFGMIADDSFSNVTLNDSLLVANDQTVGFCAYPGPDETVKPGTISDVTITNNVFQRGPNGKCGIYGPVYSWSGTGNTWSGNTWDDGTTLSP